MANFILYLSLARRADEDGFAGMPVVSFIFQQELKKLTDNIFSKKGENHESSYDEWLKTG